MDDKLVAISPRDLRQSIGTAASPLLIDVRRSDAFDSDDSLIRAPSAVFPKLLTSGDMKLGPLAA
jgi:hypothetical protein